MVLICSSGAGGGPARRAAVLRVPRGGGAAGRGVARAQVPGRRHAQRRHYRPRRHTAQVQRRGHAPPRRAGRAGHSCVQAGPLEILLFFLV